MMLTGRGRFPISVRGASRSPSLGQALRVLRSRSALARFARYREEKRRDQGYARAANALPRRGARPAPYRPFLDVGDGGLLGP